MKNQTTLGRLLGLLAGLLIAFTPVQAQYYGNTGKVELGLGVGPMFFLGDLGGSAGIGRGFLKDVDFPQMRASAGLYLTVHPTEWLGIRVAGTMGAVGADDADAPNKGGAEVDRLERNLHFRSKIREAYAGIELYPTVFFEQQDGLTGKLRPYGIAGVGVFQFDPEVKDVDGQWVRTHPLRLEGQGFAEYPNSKPYQLTQFNLISGIGFKYYLNENMYVGTEVIYRKLFTDYLDDVSQDHYIDPIYFDKYLPTEQAQQARRLYYRGTYSYPTTRPYSEIQQRGDPKQNDSYFNTTIRLGLRLGGGGGGKTPRSQRCPVF
jgi:hypothetical protein